MKIVFLTLLAAMLFVGCNDKSEATSSEPKEVVTQAEVNATVPEANATAPIAE